MSEKLITIARFSDNIDAELAKQLLEDFGIKAVVTGQNVGNVYSGIAGLIDIELQTFESQAEQAREILESNQRQD
jgi:adenylyl- and sulfurtransferase ThiI